MRSNLWTSPLRLLTLFTSGSDELMGQQQQRQRHKGGVKGLPRGSCAGESSDLTDYSHHVVINFNEAATQTAPGKCEGITKCKAPLKSAQWREKQTSRDIGFSSPVPPQPPALFWEKLLTRKNTWHKTTGWFWNLPLALPQLFDKALRAGILFFLLLLLMSVSFSAVFVVSASEWRQVPSWLL